MRMDLHFQRLQLGLSELRSLNLGHTLIRGAGLEHLKRIPVVMYSTFFGPKDIEEITSLGAVHYMIKATRFVELCNALKYILSKNWN